MILGIDTSNYTTSAAVLDGEALTQQKQLLEVRPGRAGAAPERRPVSAYAQFAVAV